MPSTLARLCRYTQAVVMGAAASGVSIGVLRLASKGALPQTLDGLRISTQVGWDNQCWGVPQVDCPAAETGTMAGCLNLMLGAY